MDDVSSYDALDDQSIDRLVDGEIASEERRTLLLRFDHEPDGWRRCALAFLEAQSWRSAMVPLMADAGESGRTKAMVRRAPKKNPRRRLARWVAVGGSLAASFALGWAVHFASVGTPAEVAHAHANITDSVPQTKSTIASDRAAATNGVIPSAPKDLVLTDAMVKRLEQQGYRAELQRRTVSLEMNDGKRLNVPVQEVRLRYVGDRTY